MRLFCQESESVINLHSAWKSAQTLLRNYNFFGENYNCRVYFFIKMISLKIQSTSYGSALARAEKKKKKTEKDGSGSRDVQTMFHKNRFLLFFTTFFPSPRRAYTCIKPSYFFEWLMSRDMCNVYCLYTRAYSQKFSLFIVLSNINKRKGKRERKREYFPFFVTKYFSFNRSSYEFRRDERPKSVGRYDVIDHTRTSIWYMAKNSLEFFLFF